MGTDTDNKAPAEAGEAPVARPAAGQNAALRAPAAAPGSTALTVTGDNDEEHPPQEQEHDARLDRMPMQLDVLVKVHSFRVRDLLSLEKGAVVETIHEHSQDVPIRCGGSTLVWTEFEVLDQQLAVRITRLG
jgi:flagellar motor switch protein FliM